MTRKTDISQYALIPAILALAGAAFLLKPEELRRNPLLEAQGVVGMAAIYEVMYAQCTARIGPTSPTARAPGAAKEQAATAYAYHFPAHSDCDAALFAANARPQCNVASLYRLDRSSISDSRFRKYARTRVNL